MNVTKELQTKISIDDNHVNIQILRKMGLLKVLTKIWLGQDLAKDKKYSQLQAFDSMKLQDKVKAFDALTPEDKLEVLNEQLLISERFAEVNLNYFSLKEEKEVRLLKESIIQSMHINHINLESM